MTENKVKRKHPRRGRIIDGDKDPNRKRSARRKQKEREEEDGKEAKDMKGGHLLTPSLCSLSLCWEEWKVNRNKQWSEREKRWTKKKNSPCNNQSDT